MHTVVINEIENSVSPTLMRVGDIAIVVKADVPDFTEFLGHVVVRTFSGLASLTRPRSTWGEPSPSWPDFKVRILPVGTKLTITVGA